MEVQETKLDAGSWDRIVSRHGGALQQGWRYGQAFGGGARRLDIMMNGKRVGLAQVLTRKIGLGVCTSLITRGPVWLDAENRRLPSLAPVIGPHVLANTAAHA